MSTACMPLPGALRWRALHPLIDEDGACSLVYDLERAAVLEVPEGLQLHVAPALETGDPDDDLLSWLVQEDLITMDGWGGWGPDGLPATQGSGISWSLGTVSLLEGEAHVRVGGLPEEAALDSLEVAFRQGFGAPRIQLHLDWGGTFPGAGLLERIVFEGRRLAAEAGQEVSFDLTLDVDQVTPSVSHVLASLPLHVRLRCGAFTGGAAPEAEHALLLLRPKDLADRVTLCFHLDGDTRLKELWIWAGRRGVRHLDAVRRPAGPLEEGTPADAWLRDLRADLLEIVGQIGAGLESGTAPIDFRPVTRVVRRLLQSEPLARFREERFGGWPILGGESGDGAEGGSCCGSCWARYLCRNSASLVSETEERTPESCAVWAEEAEAALRLYHRLAQADPLQVLRVFGNASGLPDEFPSLPAAELWSAKAPC